MCFRNNWSQTDEMRNFFMQKCDSELSACRVHLLPAGQYVFSASQIISEVAHTSSRMLHTMEKNLVDKNHEFRYSWTAERWNVWKYGQKTQMYGRSAPGKLKGTMNVRILAITRNVSKLEVGGHERVEKAALSESGCYWESCQWRATKPCLHWMWKTKRKKFLILCYFKISSENCKDIKTRIGEAAGSTVERILETCRKKAWLKLKPMKP